MGKIIKKSLVCLFCLFMTSGLFPKDKIKEKDLDQKYRDFLNLTRYIMVSQEKDVFMILEANRDRDIFIQTFWKKRDPTLGTPQNEYREELIKRFHHANKFFSRGTSREGWRTDMGRFHIILGEPTSKHRFYGKRGIWPTEVWYYYGDKEKGLPTYFGLVFYKRKAVGEYKLYDPVSDGISELLVNADGLYFGDYQALYERINELVPTLAPVSISMIPGEIPYNFMPSPRNTMILADILESPKKDVNYSYATHFLDYKGMVSTEYMTNYIESVAHVDFIRDPLTGVGFLHFSIFPKTVSFDYFEPKDQYFSNFKLNVSLRKGEEIIFQYSKDFPIYFSPAEAEKIKNSGISIEDSFPVIEGRYKVIILLQNSVAKEFTVYEKDIHVPSDSGEARIIGPVLGYGLKKYPFDSHLPYKVLDKKLIIDPEYRFSATENLYFVFAISNVTQKLWEGGKVNVLIRGLKPNNPSEKSFVMKLSNFPFNRILSLMKTASASEFYPDYYEMRLSLLDENGKILDEQKENFIISMHETVPHPTAQATVFPLADKFIFFYVLGDQYDMVQDYEKAAAYYQKGYELKPDFKRGLINYAHFLIKLKNFEKSLELIEKIKDDENIKFDYYLVKGIVFMELGKYAEAIDNLLEGNKIYNSDIMLLNSLGFCYYNILQNEKALDAFKASFSLNPNQSEIKRLVKEIERKLK